MRIQGVLSLHAEEMYRTPCTAILLYRESFGSTRTMYLYFSAVLLRALLCLFRRSTTNTAAVVVVGCTTKMLEQTA